MFAAQTLLSPSLPTPVTEAEWPLLDRERFSPRLVPDRPPSRPAPQLSVIVLNYNGGQWLERCLASLRSQTLFDHIEVIIADNASPDGSVRLAAKLVQDWPAACVQALGGNFGYSQGNNRAAELALGRYLFFLNNDTWLEPDCLERLLEECAATGAVAATPLVMDYPDNAIQFASYGGFDPFGLLAPQTEWSRRQELFVAGGCSLLIEAEWFYRLGGFDPQFFMYADEYDLCCRLWLAGGRVVLAPSAKLHHRSAAFVNPRGCEHLEEVRTSDSKRYYANRNNLLVLLKNCQHVLLLMVPLQLLLLLVEGLVMGLLSRRWSHVRRGYVEAVRDCWRLRRHILAERRRLRAVRRHGDFWLLRFFRWRLNRWAELRRWCRFGLPKVDAR